MTAQRILVLAVALAGCRTYQTIETGHKGLLFDPHGTRREILPEGRYLLGHFCAFHACGKVIDFDVTYTTAHEQIATTSKDNLTFDVSLSIIYKPIVAELYELATEVSTTDYYKEVVQPEFRSAASRVLAHHLWTELGADKEKIENEMEADVQRRIQGKHIAVSSITIEFTLPPEIRAANQARIVSEQESVRAKAQIENEDLKQKLAAQRESERAQQQTKNRESEAQLELERQVQAKQNEREIAKVEAERLLEQKKTERVIAEEDAKLEKAKAAATIAKAHADAEARIITARALAEENRAKTLAISPLTVQMKAYEALGQLGGNGTTVMLGDFSKIPQFLLPPSLAQGMLPFFPRSNERSGGTVGRGGASAP
jgi:hypothetical protein